VVVVGATVGVGRVVDGAEVVGGTVSKRTASEVDARVDAHALETTSTAVATMQSRRRDIGPS
jgi:hypothetical protein